MNWKTFLVNFVLTFVVAVIAAAGTTFLFNLIFHGGGGVDWEQAFRFGVIFGVTFGIVFSLKKHNPSDE